MTNIDIDFNRTVGKIKAMHGIGQPPLCDADTGFFYYLKDAHIPYSRLHDVGGMYGMHLFVDIPNIFKDFDADVNDEASYDFLFTDILIKALVDNGVEPYFRLGVSIENYHKIVARRIFPPKDYQKWAEICEHIVRHYNEGWNNGFFYNITYWEIWNEPDGHKKTEENAMWKGTREEYFELYKTTSLHLRKCFGNSIKIGGYGSCGFYVALQKHNISGEAFGISKELLDWNDRITGFLEFFNAFIAFVKENNLPFDFFSYHSYETVKNNLIMQKYCEKLLEDAGFCNIEIHFNEWNTDPAREHIGTSHACANAVATMIEMQNTKMQIMCYYDARMRPSSYAGMFNCLTQKPYALYYGFKAFGELYELGTQVYSKCDNEDVYVLAAKGKGKKAVLITNIGHKDALSIDMNTVEIAFLIDKNHHYTEMPLDDKKLVLCKNQTVILFFK